MEKLAEEMEYMELAETENYERIFTDSMIFPTFLRRMRMEYEELKRLMNEQKVEMTAEGADEGL